MKIQETLSYKTWSPLLRQAKRAKIDFNLQTSHFTESLLEGDLITKMVSENAVIVFGRRDCCLCHVVKQLLQGLGANPVVHEIQDAEVKYFYGKYENTSHFRAGKVFGGSQFPMVFIGGKLYGGLDRVIATLISEELVPVLKQAGALWL